MISLQLQPLLNVDSTESWIGFYSYVCLPNDEIPTAYFRMSLEADTNTTHQIWWGTPVQRLGFHSNPGLYDPWVWSTQIEALHQTTFVDVGWSLDGGQVCCPCLLHSTVDSGVKRWCCIIQQYRCCVAWGIGWKVHGDTYPGEITEPVSRKFDFVSLTQSRLWVRNFAGPVRRTIRERVLRGEAHLPLAIW